MNSISHRPTIQMVAPFVCELMGAEKPRMRCTESLERTDGIFAGGKTLDRLLIYAPDAIGEIFLRRFQDIRQTFAKAAPIEIHLYSVIPPKTPVCFASMFSGAPPSVHGITKYERPVLAVDTMFDAILRAGKRIAIAAVKDSSIDLIFRNRTIDYFSEAYDSEVTDRTLELIKTDEHELILAYHQEYDDLLHRFGPYSTEAAAAAQRHSESAKLFAETLKNHWKGKRWGMAITPDHGGHQTNGERLGDHGDNIPEDMEVMHFWRLEVNS